MQVAIIHISDFHVKASDRFLDIKINKFLDSLNVLGKADEYVIIFSGDLAHSGAIEEYKLSRKIIGRIIGGIKEKYNVEHIQLQIIPGNHDLTLTKESRNRALIQQYYDDNIIDLQISKEIDFLNNFYQYSHANFNVPKDKIVERHICDYGNYRIQFNLINTSLFSTLEPNDKELHYFPHEKMGILKKMSDVDICFTVMHHSCECFNWRYKNDLEKTIINNSEMVFSGHDHYENTKRISIENDLDTWISCTGEMKFSDISFQDAFNAFLLDTENITFCGYTFEWNSREKLYLHRIIIDNKPIQNKTERLAPLPSFIKELKEDTCNPSEDFTKYFVFPKLASGQKNEYGKAIDLKTSDSLLEYIEEKKRIMISGASNSGRTSLLKYLYFILSTSKVPLLLMVDSNTKIKAKTFIKRLFEDQYGDDPILYEKYQQMEKSSKVLIIDGWELFENIHERERLLQIVKEQFEFVIVSNNNIPQDIVESIKDEIDNDPIFIELQIKPFYAETRNQLVRNICLQNNAHIDDINRVNRIIDNLVENNSNL